METPPEALIPLEPAALVPAGLQALPPLIAAAGPDVSRRFLEFFVATIRNKNTRLAYARAVWAFFAWCGHRHLALEDIEPIHVATYIEHHPGAKPTVKQHLAAIRMCFDWLITGGILLVNPAHAVRGPTHVVSRGKTPVLSTEEARQLLDAIEADTLVGLRDRALIGVMTYTFGRVSAAIGMRVEDYFQHGKRWWIRLHEKGGKRHEVPAHHTLEAYLDGYLDAAELWEDLKGPLFRTVDRHRRLTGRALHRTEVLRMIKRRARAAGLPASTCCHTFRATGITAYLEHGGTIEHAQQIAAHASPKTTKLYDRRGDAITLDEIERIGI
jgi:integrase/recombinase XerD